MTTTQTNAAQSIDILTETTGVVYSARSMLRGAAYFRTEAEAKAQAVAWCNECGTASYGSLDLATGEHGPRADLVRE